MDFPEPPSEPDNPYVHLQARDDQIFQQEMERLALEDALTGLPNRRLFRDRVEHGLLRSRREGGVIAVLFLDLDRFKVVNDTLGHAAGDEVLTRVGRRIRECLRDEDTVARLGGDEFAVLLEEAGGRRSVQFVVERILRAFLAPHNVGGVPVHLGVSVGIALSTDDHPSAQDLLRFADIAMYRAKEKGRGGIHFYDPDRDTAPMQRLHLENELRRAIDWDEIFLRFHPIVELETGRVTGAEVLARWEHPDEGTLSPADFIPLAEETGLIVPLGRQILVKACRQLRRWQDLLEGRSHLTLNVNLSAGQLGRGLVEEVAGILGDEGPDPAGLQVELTESIVIQGMERARELKDLGLRLAVDDFGTGYSPFTYLKDLQVDTIKIDRSFVRGLGKDPADGVITRSILLLGEGLGLSVVAEGIETPEHRRILLEHGCRLGQGYLFSRPLPAPDFEALLIATPEA